jgi:hypothetical protein
MGEAKQQALMARRQVVEGLARISHQGMMSRGREHVIVEINP